MKVIIAGSRTIRSTRIVEECIRASGFEIDEVVCGEAQGVDLTGKCFAIRNHIPCKSFHAEWYKFGKAAGPMRNTEMAKYADALILVWDGQSRGSKNMLEIARRFGLKIYERVV